MPQDLSPAEARAQARAIKDYLAALAAAPKKGRRFSAEELRSRVDALSQRIDAEENPLKKTELIQARLDLQDRVAAGGDEGPDISALESEFVKVAKGYSERKSISYVAWRQIGVPARVLKAAGISRASSKS